MEQLPQLEAQTLVSGVIILVLFIMFIFVMSWWVICFGKRNLKQEIEYESLYRTIDFMINDMDVTQDSFLKIDLYYQQLKALPWKDAEKTHVIASKFYQKYAQIRIKNHLQL